MGRAVFPPCCLTWDQTMVEVMKIMATSFKSFLAWTAALSAPDPAAGHHQPMPLPGTPGTQKQVWVSLLWSHCSFLLGLGAHKVLSVPSQSLFPQSSVSSVIKFHCPPKSYSLGFLSNFSRSPGWKSVVDPRTFLTLWEFLWCNCSAVCGLPARWLCCRVNGDLFQEGLCYMLCDLGLLHPEPLPLVANHCWPIPLQEMETQVWLSLGSMMGDDTHQ